MVGRDLDAVIFNPIATTILKWLRFKSCQESLSPVRDLNFKKEAGIVTIQPQCSVGF
jgi:hypothetical protein